ncbi:hypothetical protein [Janthinobacterium sp. GW458P]|uniref:hypothetical protein n=1 Tax=Janthinobacterium sp. GW458P TaxID=1981504 RepID=UPI001123D6F5|nr:hypothetical protein [Janthinobacterium sp. GW458P]MBE3025113.1 hypothetical protein [Janthinobacterium sp. GW458P]
MTQDKQHGWPVPGTEQLRPSVQVERQYDRRAGHPAVGDGARELDQKLVSYSGYAIRRGRRSLVPDGKRVPGRKSDWQYWRVCPGNLYNHDNQKPDTVGWHGKWASDNFELRYADRLIDVNRDLILGLTLNNYPSLATHGRPFMPTASALLACRPVLPATAPKGRAWRHFRAWRASMPTMSRSS